MHCRVNSVQYQFQRSFYGNIVLFATILVMAVYLYFLERMNEPICRCSPALGALGLNSPFLCLIFQFFRPDVNDPPPMVSPLVYTLLATDSFTSSSASFAFCRCASSSPELQTKTTKNNIIMLMYFVTLYLKHWCYYPLLIGDRCCEVGRSSWTFALSCRESYQGHSSSSSCWPSSSSKQPLFAYWWESGTRAHA